MSKFITGDEPATGFIIPQNFDNYENGLTIRQQFAMAAMQGIMVNRTNLPDKGVALLSVRIADALINELNTTSK